MPEFQFQEMFPLDKGDTPYRKLTDDFVSVGEYKGSRILEVDRQALTLLAAESIRDISHLFRPSHLAQLAQGARRPRGHRERPLRRPDDAPERLRVGRHGAAELPGHRHGDRHGQEGPTGLDPGRSDGSTRRRRGGPRPGRVPHLHRDQPALLPGRADHRCTRRSTPGSNLPAQIDLSAVDGDAYNFLTITKGGGSANKTFLFQETKALLNPTSLLEFIDDKIRTLGTSACPPYHLAIVIGGTSAEMNLKTVKLASTRYLDDLPSVGKRARSRHPRRRARGRRSSSWRRRPGSARSSAASTSCHDVRVIRLPRHGASCPVGIGVSCSADRQSLGKITADGVFVEQLEHDPAKYLPEVTEADLRADVVRVDLTQPMDAIRAQLSAVPDQDPALAERADGRRPRHRPRQARRSASSGARACPST